MRQEAPIGTVARTAFVILAAGMLATLVMPRASHAQAGSDSLRLGVLVDAALRIDPRQRQFELQQTQTQLRLQNLDAEWRPQLKIEGFAQYQSDVVLFPGGVTPPHDTYDIHLNANQRIFDPAASPRRAAEKAQLAASLANVKTNLYAVRLDVHDAFFSAALLQERANALATTIQDLESRLREAEARVREGAALRGEAAAIEATLLERRQDVNELRADRSAALARLSELTGQPIPPDAALALPDLAATVAEARAADQHRGRPEYEQFQRTREQLDREGAVVGARDAPTFTAFGRFGYANPGQRLITDVLDTYWMTGIQATWSLWNWGSSQRERDALVLQEDVVSADEAAFTRSLRRAVELDVATMDRLDTTLVMDDRIVALRETIQTETRARFQEGVVTASDYLDRSTDLLESRLAQVAHRVQRTQARARYLTTLGLEVR